MEEGPPSYSVATVATRTTAPAHASHHRRHYSHPHPSTCRCGWAGRIHGSAGRQDAGAPVGADAAASAPPPGGRDVSSPAGSVPTAATPAAVAKTSGPKPDSPASARRGIQIKVGLLQARRGALHNLLGGTDDAGRTAAERWSLRPRHPREPSPASREASPPSAGSPASDRQPSRTAASPASRGSAAGSANGSPSLPGAEPSRRSAMRCYRRACRASLPWVPGTITRCAGAVINDVGDRRWRRRGLGQLRSGDRTPQPRWRWSPAAAGDRRTAPPGPRPSPRSAR